MKPGPLNKLICAAAVMALAACGDSAPPEREVVDDAEVIEDEAPVVDNSGLEGVTPMNERIATVGFLNKRNGITRDVEMRPGQSIRIGDAVVRLRACETTAPWEEEEWTGAFLQLDVESRLSGRLERVFSGWVYAQSPSLNVVEHPVYDVWPKSCAMNFPGEAGGTAAPVEAPPEPDPETSA